MLWSSILETNTQNLIFLDDRQKKINQKSIFDLLNHRTYKYLQTQI